MGFFERIGKILARAGKNEGEPPQEKNSLREKRAFDIEGLERELALAEKRELDVSEKARAALDGVGRQLEQLRSLVKKLEASSVGRDVDYAKIGESMRKQFVERMLLLFDSLEMPKQLEYRPLVDYHSRLLKFLAAATKNASDNRYVFHFFSDDMKSFASMMKALGAEADELENALREKAGKAKTFAEIDAGLKAVRENWATRARFEKLLGEETSALREIEKSIEAGKSRSRSLDAELDEARLEEGRLAAKQSEARSRVASAFSPFKRLLRKYAHAAPKNERTLAKKYAENPVMALLESRDASECKTLLSRLQEFAEKEGEDAKYSGHFLYLESTLTNSLKDYSIIEEQLGKASEKQRELQARKTEENARAEEGKRLLENIERLKTRIAEEKAKQDKLLCEIEEKAGGLLHAGVKIRSYSSPEK